MYCVECHSSISKEVFEYSNRYFGDSLCIKHQRWIKTLLEQSSTTIEALTLYFALKKRGISAEIEKNDGFKSVDIVVEEAKAHIEVDGVHHNNNNIQALKDLKRTYHSFKEGYITLRIPNSLMYNDLQETVDYLIGILEINKKRLRWKAFSIFRLFN